MSNPPAAPGTFNELDPHGAEQPGHGQHHSHVIVGPFTLRSILGILLVLTILTVGQAQAELFFTSMFEIKFPLWVNIVVVMGIATVKAVLVMAFFMQLRYDNPLNTIIMAFCFFAMALFLGFTSMDLLTRGRVNEWKASPVIAGGTGAGVVNANGQTLIVAARERYMEKFLSDDALVEARLTARLLDEAAHHALLAGPSDHGEGSNLSQEARAAEAIAAVTAELRHKLVYRQSLTEPRTFASEELAKAAATLAADGHTTAASIVTAAAQAAASGPFPADSKELAQHDYDLLKVAAHSHGSHGGHHEAAGSTKNASRGKTGLSGAVDGLNSSAHGHDAEPAKH